jgi:hypothetical protein
MRFNFKVAVVAGVAATAFAVSAGVASAVIAVSTAPGTAAPPATLQYYQMTPFGDVDVRPTSPGCAADTTTVPLPPITTGHPLSRPTGDIVFNQAATHGDVATACWATWSHGYTLDVYATYNSLNPNSLTMTMPAKVGALYLYAEPNIFGVFLITATGRDGNGHQVTTTIAVDGFAGARYIGFYNTTFGAVTSITVSAEPAAGGFAIGEFGVGNQKLVRIT